MLMFLLNRHALNCPLRLSLETRLGRCRAHFAVCWANPYFTHRENGNEVNKSRTCHIHRKQGGLKFLIRTISIPSPPLNSTLGCPRCLLLYIIFSHSAVTNDAKSIKVIQSIHPIHSNPIHSLLHHNTHPDR